MSKTITTNSLNVHVSIADNSDEVLAALKNAIDRALDSVGTNAVKHAVQIITDAPAVDTGRLRNSITYAKGGESAAVSTYEDDNGKVYAYSGNAPQGKNTLYIGTNVEYALDIETGTHRKKGAVHFLQRAANDYTEEYKGIVTDSLNNA